jgi:hypothetical protein
VAALIAGGAGVAGSVLGARMQQDASREQVQAQTTFDQQKLLREQRIATGTAFLAAVQDPPPPYKVPICPTKGCDEPTLEEIAAEGAYRDDGEAVANAYVSASLYATDAQLDLMQEIIRRRLTNSSYSDERSALLDLLRAEAQFAATQ